MPLLFFTCLFQGFPNPVAAAFTAKCLPLVREYLEARKEFAEVTQGQWNHASYKMLLLNQCWKNRMVKPSPKAYRECEVNQVCSSVSANSQVTFSYIL